MTRLEEKLKDKGFKVMHLFPVYYQGWEMDEWAAVVEKDGIVNLAVTNHGSLQLLHGTEARSHINTLLEQYDDATRDTKLALEYLPRD